MGDAGNPRRFACFHFGLADVVFIFFALTILQRAHDGLVDDPGLGWHIRIPDAMAEQGGFLETDPFGSHTRGQPWIPWGFLGSAALHYANAWGELRGLAVLTTLILALVLRCLYRMLIRDGVPWPQALFWTYLAALGTSSGWVARPNLFTLLFLLIVVRVCVQLHRGQMSPRYSLWLLPLFTVWVNTHGGFVAGLLTIGAAGLIEAGLALANADERASAWRRFRWFAVLGFASLAATLINPYTWRLHAQVVRLTQDTFFMNLNDDWLSPNFHAAGAFRFELLILLLPLLLALSPRRPDAVSLGLAVVWLHFALQGRRYVPLWVLTVVPLLATLAAETAALRRLSAWVEERMRDGRPAPAPVPAPAGPVPWFWSAAFAVGLFVSTAYVGNYAAHAQEHMPSQALDRFLELQHGQPTFHSINYGGYLTWHGWDRQPRFLTWIDDRNEFQGQARTEEWLDLTETRGNWRKTLEKYDFRLICVEAHTPLANRLSDDAGWEELYRDKYAVIFGRRSEQGTSLEK